MNMRKLVILLIAMTITMVADAQELMSKAIDNLRNSLSSENITDENMSSWELADGNSRGTQSSTYFSIPESKMTLVNAIVKAYDKDRVNAYSSASKAAGKSTFNESVAYGKRNSKSMGFGSHKERNYRLLFFRDPNNENRRTVLALVWYEGRRGNIDGSIHKIYGDDPQRVSSSSYSSYNWKNFDVDMAKLNEDLSQLKNLSQLNDLSKLGILSGSISSYAIEPDSVTNAEQFLSQFGNARTAYLKYVQNPDRISLLTGIANKVVALSKKAKRVLTTDEREACRVGIDSMINSTGDAYLKSLLNVAKKNF